MINYYLAEPKRSTASTTEFLPFATKKRLTKLLKAEVDFYEWIRSRLLQNVSTTSQKNISTYSSDDEDDEFNQIPDSDWTVNTGKTLKCDINLAFTWKFVFKRIFVTDSWTKTIGSGERIEKGVDADILRGRLYFETTL